jgi:hypothetical protein
MAPAGSLDYRRVRARALIEFVVSGIGVGLHDAAAAGQILAWMLAATASFEVNYLARYIV